MTNMQAALGVAQLERLDEFVARKREMGALYSEMLSSLEGVQLPLKTTDYAENIYWVYGLLIDESRGMSASVAREKLAEKGVGTRPFFCPIHQQPVLNRLGYFEGERLPISERLYRQGFYIPSGIALTREQIERVAEAVKAVFA